MCLSVCVSVRLSVCPSIRLSAPRAVVKMQSSIGEGVSTAALHQSNVGFELIDERENGRYWRADPEKEGRGNRERQ